MLLTITKKKTTALQMEFGHSGLIFDICNRSMVVAIHIMKYLAFITFGNVRQKKKSRDCRVVPFDSLMHDCNMLC